MRQLGDDRRGAGSRSAAHPGGDKDEIRAVENHRDIFTRLFRRFAPDVGIRARAEAPCDVVPDLHGVLRLARTQRLNVGVDREKVDVRESGLDHAVDGVAAAASDAEHFDGRGMFGVVASGLGHRCLRKECGVKFALRLLRSSEIG